MPHLLTIVLAIVRLHDQHEASAGLQGPPRLGERPFRLRYVMEHQHQGRHIESLVVYRQRLELAAPEVDILEWLQAFLRRLEHRRRRVHRHHACDERRERGAHGARPAAEIAHDPVALGERGERREVKAIAKQLVADAIPLARRRGKELLRLRAPLGQRGLEPPLILRGRRRGTHLFADEQPEAPRRSTELVSGHRVQTAGPLRARSHPPVIGERFEMPAHGRLRQLQDSAQLGNGQLMPIEEQQDPAARRIGQRGQMIEDSRCAAIHP